LVQDAKEHESEDKRQRELADIRNQADQTIYSVEKALKELGDRVPADERSRVEQMVKDAQEAVKENDASRIRNLVEQLQQANYAFSQQSQQHDQGESMSEDPQNDKGDDVIEGEFKEL